MTKQYSQDYSQEFRVGDKVIYFITNKIGTVKEVKKHKFDNYIDIIVDYGNNDVCEYEIGSEIKRPFLLHYRDDYNYDVIDFNNLPKRGRVKKGEKYYYLDMYLDVDMSFIVDSYIEGYSNIDTKFYNSGNYFKTKEQAQEVADKLNEYVKQLNKSKAMNIDKYLDNTIKTHNGYVYKSEDSFNNYPYKVCYISEKRIDELIEKYKNKNIDLNDGEILSLYLGESRHTIITCIKEHFELPNMDIIKGEKIDRLVFEYLDWQSVDLLLNDLEDEIYNIIKNEV